MAGLIPQNFIDDLLDRTDIVELVDSRMSLRKAGRNYTGLCPFHQEKTPSFSVSPDKQFYYCFGCGAGGNAIGFIMEHDRIDFRSAVEDLARRVGLEVPQEAAPANPELQQKQRSLYDQLSKVQDFYQQQLREHPQRTKAVNYLKQRGLTGEIAKAFGIGYAPPGWNNLGKALNRSEKDKQQLVESGMLIEKEDKHQGQGRDSYDRFRDRVMFPIRDSRGRIIAFGGRVLGDDKPKYLNSPESPVFHKGRELYGLYEARQASNRLTRFIIVEGYMDVVALAQHEVTNAVATLGTATSEDHLKKLFRMVPEVVFCFDGDRAGLQAAERALNTALSVMEDGRQIGFMFLPDGEDPDTLIRKEGKEAFIARADKAQSLPDFFFDTLRQEVDTDSLDGKARLCKLALKKMQPMPNGLLRQLMLDQLASLANLSVNRLLEFTPAAESETVPDEYQQEYSEYSQSDSPNTPQKRPDRPTASNRKMRTPAEQATALLLHYPQFIELVEDQSKFDTPNVPGMELLRTLIRLLKQNPSLNPGGIIGHWQGGGDQESYEEIARLAMIELPVLDQTHLKEKFLNTLQLILSHNQDQILVDLLEKAKITQLSEQEKEQLKQLLQEKSH